MLLRNTRASARRFAGVNNCKLPSIMIFRSREKKSFENAAVGPQAVREHSKFNECYYMCVIRASLRINETCRKKKGVSNHCSFVIHCHSDALPVRSGSRADRREAMIGERLMWPTGPVRGLRACRPSRT